VKTKDKWAQEYAENPHTVEPFNAASYQRRVSKAFLAGFEKAKTEALKHVLKSILAAEGQPYIERRYVMAGDIERLGEEEV